MKAVCDKMTCCKDKKSICIGVLLLLVIILAVMAFGKSDSESANTNIDISSIPVGSTGGDGSKVSPMEIMQTVSIEGLSLNTKIDDITSKAENAGFSCKQTGDIKVHADWTCNHNKSEGTMLTVTSGNGQIIRIAREGKIAESDMPKIMDAIDAMKYSVNTRKDVNFSQSNDNYTINIRSGESSLDFSITSRRDFDRSKIGEEGFDPRKMMEAPMIKFFSAVVSVAAPERVPETSPEAAAVVPVEEAATATVKEEKKEEESKASATEDAPNAAEEKAPKTEPAKEKAEEKADESQKPD